MCECIKSPGIVAGWVCHQCRAYNGLWRTHCKGCDLERCKPLSPDPVTGERFETYDEAYAGDHDMLARVKAQLPA